MVFDKWYLIKSISAVTNYNSSSCFILPEIYFCIVHIPGKMNQLKISFLGIFTILRSIFVIFTFPFYVLRHV